MFGSSEDRFIQDQLRAKFRETCTYRVIRSTNTIEKRHDSEPNTWVEVKVHQSFRQAVKALKDELHYVV
jgi:hypothetical protein